MLVSYILNSVLHCQGFHSLLFSCLFFFFFKEWLSPVLASSLCFQRTQFCTHWHSFPPIGSFLTDTDEELKILEVVFAQASWICEEQLREWNAKPALCFHIPLKKGAVVTAYPLWETATVSFMDRAASVQPHVSFSHSTATAFGREELSRDEAEFQDH